MKKVVYGSLLSGSKINNLRLESSLKDDNWLSDQPFGHGAISFSNECLSAEINTLLKYYTQY